MGAGPPEPPCRGRLQTTASCADTTVRVVSVAEKASQEGRQVRAGKANASDTDDDASRRTHDDVETEVAQ